MLYVAPGDGGCCGDPNNNAQNLTSYLGKILRLNVRTLPYTIPAGNPFTSQEGKLREIWAYGLRNPWRYAFDAPSGLLFVGDVGQDSREEVDVVSANAGGYNFGWRVMEATACYIPSSGCNTSGLTLPALDYPHSDGCSVTGGYVYRGAAIPELTGHYLYADYCNGWLRSFKAAPGTHRTELTAPGIRTRRRRRAVLWDKLSRRRGRSLCSGRVGGFRDGAWRALTTLPPPVRSWSPPRARFEKAYGNPPPLLHRSLHARAERELAAPLSWDFDLRAVHHSRFPE